MKRLCGVPIHLSFLTEEGRHLLITAATGHGQDLVPTAQDAIDNEAVMAKDFPFLF